MGNTRFNENSIKHEQNIIDGLYKIFLIDNKTPDQLDNFKQKIKQTSSAQIKNENNYKLENELNNLIISLEYFEKTRTPINTNIKNIFNALETILEQLNLSDFEEEIFNNFNTVINKTMINFLNNNALEKIEDRKKIILKYGDLIALIHKITITKTIKLYNQFFKKLENDEQKSKSTTNKILELEAVSKKQTNTIKQIISTIKSFQRSQNKK